MAQFFKFTPIIWTLSQTTTITIDIPYKKLIDDDGKDVSIYVQASIVDIRGVIEPLIGTNVCTSQTKNSTKSPLPKETRIIP